MVAILITQCLQNDFVKPLQSNEPLPNKLHVGHQESKRLMGDDPASGPVGQFMSWANSSHQQPLYVIHIRDWHNLAAPSQSSHLHQFGPHCIQDTPGAEFVFSIPQAPNNHIINSTILNDFAGTDLQQHIDTLLEKHTGETIQLGIIGVWTEAKVLFLAYELSTRYPQMEIAICSALTASSSRSHHFLALQQLQRIVGTVIKDSIGEFVEFLGGRNIPALHQNFNSGLNIQYPDKLQLDDESELLIRYLFRDCQSLTMTLLDGGFSGNLVAGIRSIDIHGHEQAPHVIKIGPRELMAKERTAFEQVEQVLGNNAPAIADHADALSKGAIKYRYASIGNGKTHSLQWCIQNNLPAAAIQQYLTILFSEQLGRFYRAASNDSQDLLEYYWFSSKWASSVQTKIQELIETIDDGDQIVLPGNKKVNNLAHFYRHDLDQLPVMVADYPFSFVHGDLNGANVIIDEKENVWLIDFFHTHKGHVLKDFAKLENDLLYICTAVENDDDLIKAYAFSDFLLQSDDPLSDQRALPETLQGTAFERSFIILRHIRQLANKVIAPSSPNRLWQWLIPQLRYSVHTIGFDEPNTRQRIWSLYTSCLIADKIKTATQTQLAERA